MKTLAQLYSASNFLPWDGVLDQIGEQGFDGVEDFLMNFDDP